MFYNPLFNVIGDTCVKNSFLKVGKNINIVPSGTHSEKINALQAQKMFFFTYVFVVKSIGSLLRRDDRAKENDRAKRMTKQKGKTAKRNEEQKK